MIIRRILETLIYFLLAVIILLSPIFLGSVEPISKMFLRLEILSIFIIWLIIGTFFKEDSKIRIPGKSLVLLLAFIFFCFVQILPMPSALINLLSPETGNIWQSSNEIIRHFSVDYSSHYKTLSIVPHYTKNMLIGIICYVLLGYITSEKISSARAISLVVFSLAAVLFFESLVGIYQFISGNNALSRIESRIASGTFVNKNHFAGFMELSIPLTTCYLIYQIHSFKSKEPFTTKFFKSFQTAILTFITGLSLVVFVFSFSRMGYVSLSLAILITLLVHVKITGNFNRKMIIPLVFIMIFTLFGISKSFDTFSESIIRTHKDIGSRIIIYKDTLNAIRDFPLTGSGLGTFKVIYPGYKTLEQAFTVNYAHNDYLQLLLETGLIGFLLLISSLVLFLKSALRKIQSHYNDKNYFHFYIKLGAFCSITSILIHSFCDFNLHIQSNAAYFAILMGIIACRENDLEKAKTKRYKKRAIPLSGARNETGSANN